MLFKRSRSPRRPQNAPDRKLRVEPLERRNLLAINVFPVNDFTGTGTGSLSWAIAAANISPNDLAGPDKIVFELSGATRTIASQTPLPVITEAVVIDGYHLGGDCGQ
jgi:hypothetical protein